MLLLLLLLIWAVRRVIRLLLLLLLLVYPLHIPMPVVINIYLGIPHLPNPGRTQLRSRT